MDDVWAQESGTEDDHTVEVEPVEAKFSNIHGSFDVRWVPNEQYLESKYSF